MFLHQGTDIVINSTDAVTNITNLKTIRKVQIPAHCTAAIQTKLTGKCITVTACILEVETYERVNI